MAGADLLRRRYATIALVLSLTTFAGGCGSSDTTPATTARATPTGTTPGTATPTLVSEVTGLTQPIQVVRLPDSPTHLWVLEQSGLIRNVRDGVIDKRPVADLRAGTASGGERGLLSLTLHPNFPATDLVYVHRSDTAGDTLVTEHRVDAGHIALEPSRTLLRVRQPFSNHNGGTLAFGPDGLLYLGLGDGGSGGDPQGNGQNLDSQLGKLLRVDLATPNEWQVAAYGLRNPWRFSFDPASGDAWIGDVGQNAWEEVNRFPNGAGLTNFGWSVREGRHPYSGGGNSQLQGRGRVAEPVAEYSHDDGCSITGGVVVHDRRLPSLLDRYLFADYCSGTFWSIPATGEPVDTPRREPFRADSPVSIDAAADGTVYVTSHNGVVLRLAAQ